MNEKVREVLEKLGLVPKRLCPAPIPVYRPPRRVRR